MVEEAFQRALARAARRPSRVERRVAAILHDDVPSFMEVPVANSKEDLVGADAVILGIPYEGLKLKDPRTVLPAAATPAGPEPEYFRSGADAAPDAIRRNSLYYSIDHAGGLFPEQGRDFVLLDHLTIRDYGDVEVVQRDAEETVRRAVARVSDVLHAGAVPLVMGGDHTIPFPVVRAIVENNTDKRIGVISFDSHFDLSWESGGTRYWAGSQWTRILELPNCSPDNMAIVGIRGLRNPFSWTYAAQELGVTYYSMWDVEERGIVDVTREALEIVTRGVDLLYVSLDIDVVDVAFCPAQKYPDPGGLTSREVLRALRMALETETPVCGFDLCCLGPQYDVNNMGSQLAARCFVEVLGGLGRAKSRRSALPAGRQAGA